MGFEVNGPSGATPQKKVEIRTEFKTQKKIEIIFGDNKTKTITRKVNGEDHQIIVGKNAKGEKVRVDAQTGEELVAIETTGKNKYQTKAEFDRMLQETYGMTSKDFAAQGIVPQYEHGKLVFKQLGSGDKASADDLKNALANHEQQTKMNEQIKKDLANLKVDMPEIQLPEIKMPEINKEDLKDLAVVTEEVKPQGTTTKHGTETIGKVRVSEIEGLALPEVVVTGKRKPKPQGMNGNRGTASTEDVKKAINARKPKKIITTSHNYERGLRFPNGNTIEAEDKNSVWDSDASFNIGGGQYNLKRSRSGLPTNTLDYGDLKSDNQYGFINGETGQLNPNSRLFEGQFDRNAEKIYFSGNGELDGAQVLKYKNKVAVQINGKYYDLNALIQQNKKVEIK